MHKRASWALITFLCCNALCEANAVVEEPLTWIFLNSGAPEKAKGVSKEAMTEMQAKHIGNFGTQFDGGKLLAAGPLGDGGSIRGTVILAVNTPEQIAECFKADPYVQREILQVEAHPWLADVMKFGSSVVPFKMARHTLCIVKKGPNWKGASAEPSSESLTKMLPTLKKQEGTGELAISGAFRDASDKLGILIFYSTNKAEVQAQLETEPEVANGNVQLEFHSQFMGKGTLRNPHEDISPPKQGKPMQLFDGKSFDGWTGDTNGTWRVEDTALVGGSLAKTVPHNDFLRTTKRFKNFDMRLKVKLEGTGFVNGGIQLRSERNKNPDYEMVGYQADMGEGYWGSLYDESRRNKTLAHTHAAIIKRMVKPNDWNDYVIRCEDAHIRLWLNGVLTVDYTEDDKTIPSEGLIGLQIHGGGKATASYKDISIEELP
jgi:uncharacterized protein YciI